MRFGMLIPQGCRFDLVGIDPAEHWPVMRGLAQAADAGPFDSIWVYDHFHNVPVPAGEATHEAWSLMAAFAACTQRVRLGQMCTCVAYRNPAHLAKIAATVDVISGGRAEMGIGVGWYEHEWRAFGYGFPSAGERLGMLDEGVQILREAWTTGTVTFAGRHYRLDGAITQPRPLQGRIPLWIAGGGEKKTLRIAARYADYTNFDADPDTFRRKSEVLAAHCREVGRDFGEIVRSANFDVLIGETESDVANKLDWYRAHHAPLMSAERLERLLEIKRRAPLLGTPEQIVERLIELRSLGLGYAINFFIDAAYDPGSVKLFTERVIPELVD